MKIWSHDSGLGRFSSGSIKRFSENIFGERTLVDASEWDLHVKVACGCRSSLHRYCCGGVVAAMTTQNNGISFTHTHTHTHTHTFIITCHVSLRLVNVVVGS
jgi:hypothetical protein